MSFHAAPEGGGKPSLAPHIGTGMGPMVMMPTANEAQFALEAHPGSSSDIPDHDIDPTSRRSFLRRDLIQLYRGSAPVAPDVTAS